MFRLAFRISKDDTFHDLCKLKEALQAVVVFVLFRLILWRWSGRLLDGLMFGEARPVAIPVWSVVFRFARRPAVIAWR